MKFAVKKLVQLVVTMVIVSFITFAAFSLISGDPATNMLGTEATPERVAALREELGLNRPFILRYGEWLFGFFSGDLGVSYSYNEGVWSLISEKLLVTFCLSLMSFLLIVIVSIPAGLLTGEKSSWLSVAVNQLCMAVPPFFTGLLLTWIFGITLKLFTHGSFPGLINNPAGSLKYMIYAAVSLAVPRIAMTVRMFKSTVASELKKDYVKTAVARGAGKSTILRRHVLRNSMTPIVTFLAQTMAEIIAGSIVVEQVFAIPGLGRFLVASISNRDYPCVEAIVVILAFWVVLAGTLADIINMKIDPRLKLGGGR